MQVLILSFFNIELNLTWKVLFNIYGSACLLCLNYVDSISLNALTPAQTHVDTHTHSCTTWILFFKKNFDAYLFLRKWEKVLNRIVHLSIKYPLWEMQIFLLHGLQMCQETTSKIFSANFKMEMSSLLSHNFTLRNISGKKRFILIFLHLTDGCSQLMVLL